MTKRKKPTLLELLAAALLQVKIGEDWLIDDVELREHGTPKQIRAYVDFDHARRHAEGGGNEPQNLFPMRKPDHRAKSNTDNTEIAKGKRIGKKEAEFRRKLLAKTGQQAALEDRDTPCRTTKKIKTRPWPKTSRPLCGGRKIPSRPFPKRPKTPPTSG